MSVPSAASIISNVRIASAINELLSSVELTSIFAVQEKVYVTFSIDTQGLTGYIVPKWYSNGKLVPPDMALTVQANYTHGFFSKIYDTPTNGSVELYWCIQPDFSDAQLAATINFTVTAASSHTTD